MKVVVIDIGNSTAKVAGLSDSNYPENVSVVSLTNIETIFSLTPFLSASVVIVGSSGQPELTTNLVTKLRRRSLVVIVLDRDCPLPFRNAYAAGQAGIDRLANVAAAIEVGRLPVIVVDVGSAITMEAVGQDATFLGGAILPGIRLQAEALKAGTASLPMVTVNSDIPTVGTDTVSAIQIGILHSCAGGIERLIRNMRQIPEMASASVIFTGGDCALLTKIMKFDDARSIPGLTLRGMYLLARHQDPDSFR